MPTGQAPSIASLARSKGGWFAARSSSLYSHTRACMHFGSRLTMRCTCIEDAPRVSLYIPALLLRASPRVGASGACTPCTRTVLPLTSRCLVPNKTQNQSIGKVQREDGPHGTPHVHNLQHNRTRRRPAAKGKPKTVCRKCMLNSVPSLASVPHFAASVLLFTLVNSLSPKSPPTRTVSVSTCSYTPLC